MSETKEFVIDLEMLDSIQRSQLIAINELLHINRDLFSVQSTRFVQDYMPNSVVPENFGAYVIMRDSAGIPATTAFVLCNRDFDESSALSTHKGWINRYNYFKQMEVYPRYILTYKEYVQAVTNKPIYQQQKITLTFDTSVLSEAELITLTSLHEASLRRNPHVFIIVNELKTTYPIADAIFEFYILGKRWADIARIADRSSEALRSRASQLKATYGAKFWEAVEKARKSYMDTRMGEMKAQAKLIKMD